MKEEQEMKKLNRNDFMVINEFGSNITTIVKIYEDEKGNVHVIDEFDIDITKCVIVIRK